MIFLTIIFIFWIVSSFGRSNQSSGFGEILAQWISDPSKRKKEKWAREAASKQHRV